MSRESRGDCNMCLLIRLQISVARSYQWQGWFLDPKTKISGGNDKVGNKVTGRIMGTRTDLVKWEY